MTETPFKEDFSSADRGVVTIWNGSFSDIPQGWVVADGNNTSPNLLDAIPKGNADYSTSRERSGQNSKSLSTSQLPSHDHTGSVDSAGYHNHGVGEQERNDGATNWLIRNDRTDYTTSTTTDGAHSHDSSRTENTGSAASIENRPKSTEVIFIYKL